jgi:hypothetical protein
VANHASKPSTVARQTHRKGREPRGVSGAPRAANRTLEVRLSGAPSGSRHALPPRYFVGSSPLMPSVIERRISSAMRFSFTSVRNPIDCAEPTMIE